MRFPLALCALCTPLLTPSTPRFHGTKGFAWGRHRQVRTPPSTLTLQGPIGSAGSSRELEEKLDPLRDDDVDCDMLANAGNDGYSIERVGRDERGWRTRRRAVWEKGIRAVRFPGFLSSLGISPEKADSRLFVRLQGFHGGWIRCVLGCSRWSLSQFRRADPFALLFRCKPSALCIGEFAAPKSARFFPRMLTCTPARADYHWDDPRSEEEKSDSRRSVALGLPNPEHKSLDELADGVDISYTSAPDGFEVKFDANEVLEVVQWADDPRLRDFEAAFFDEGGVVNGQGF